MGYRRTPLMQERLAGNRERIVRVTRMLIARGGFHEASIAAVAQEAGLSTGAIYRYFPSKAALFVEMLTTAVDAEIKVLTTIVAQSIPVAMRLREAVESFASRALKGPHLAYAFIVEPTDPEVEAARILCRQRFSAIFEDLVRQGVLRGEFPAQTVNVTAACIVGAFIEALARPIATQGPSSPATDEKVVHAIAQFCLRAVGCDLEAHRDVRR